MRMMADSSTRPANSELTAMIPSAFLNSQVTRRIALLLLLAAAVPAILVSGLTHRKMAQLIHEYEHASLKEASENYAMTTFNNLLFAKTALLNATAMNQDAASIKQSLRQLEQSRVNHAPIFASAYLVSSDGIIDHIVNKSNIALAQAFKQSITNKLEELQGIKQTSIWVMPQPGSQLLPSVYLVAPGNQRSSSGWVIAEIYPDYLWGKKEDYPADFKVCVYSNNNPGSTLFCSTQATAQDKQTLSDHWDLFLKAEFQTNPWTFETTRITPSAANSLLNFYDSNGYIGIVVLSLLVVGLLSLTQIRRTMIPLERLIEGTRRITQGDFKPVQVDGKSEFSELASAFNHMSSNIQKQLNTLQTFSEIDKEMVAKLDVDHLIEQIIQRIRSLKPNVHVQIFRIIEQSDAEALCQASIANENTPSSYPVSLPMLEIDRLKNFPEGVFTHTEIELRYQQEIAALGLQHLWTLPIFWQGHICGLLTIGSHSPLVDSDGGWDEIRDLSNRIGIAISAQKREEQLLNQAHYDLLTGLPNRILLDERLKQAIEQSRRSNLPAWVLFLDLDRFKYINDSMGHHLGDQVLIALSKRLKDTIRQSDTIARFGGDEFIIVLQGHENQDLMMSELYKIIESVISPLNVSHNKLNMTCSIGIAVCPQDGDTPAILIQHADIAMYRAKELGKNNFQFFTEAMNREVVERIRIENLLRQALDRDELILHYQPKVSLKTMQIVGMEALIRWNSLELGMVSPAQFIPIAEETGLITPIGEWVIRTACTQAVAWQKAGYGNLLMSVNLSARQFNQPDLVEVIQNTLTETGLGADLLELELTESAVMSDVSASLKTLREIKALGIKISVDDFGTGYSSLAYLKALPLDTLKIDKSFVDDIVQHTDKAPIVQTIIALAKNLELKIVAEGVESYEQVLYLQARDCDEIQGYYFSKPNSAAEIALLLHTEQTARHNKLNDSEYSSKRLLLN